MPTYRVPMRIDARVDVVVVADDAAAAAAKAERMPLNDRKMDVIDESSYALRSEIKEIK